MRDRVILSLYDRSGAWSKPYLEAGYTVIRFDLAANDDIAIDADVRLIPNIGKVHGILAAPPCTVFSKCGYWYPRTDAEMIQGLSMVDAVIRLAWVLKPEWWVLENPIGKLKTYLGEPAYKFDPCDFGDAYTKRTWLWGSFNTNLKKTPVVPEHTNFKHMTQNWTQHQRSVTPAGFARAFFAANP